MRITGYPIRLIFNCRESRFPKFYQLRKSNRLIANLFETHTRYSHYKLITFSKHERMKNRLINLTCVLILCLAGQAVFSQNYNSAIGLRLGYPVSITYKTFIAQDHALEGYVGFRTWRNYSYTSVNGAYQVHFPIEGVENLQWYVGAGGGIYLWNYDLRPRDRNTQIGLGIQGYLGLDYTIPDAPLNVFVDWIPTIFLTGYRTGFFGSYGNVGVRYVLR